MNTIRKIFIVGIILVLLVSGYALADGGNQKVVEGKYIVNISSSPIAPFQGEKQAMLISFADISNRLIKEDIAVDLRLSRKLGQTVFEKKGLVAEGGILPFEYIYNEPGLYELFVTFYLPQDPKKAHQPEDFLIEVKPKNTTINFYWLAGIFIILGFALGFLLGKRFGRMAR